MKTFILALGISLSLGTVYAAPCNDANKIYKICTPQRALYNTAVAAAQQNGKLVLAQFGFEACPWCQSIHKIFQAKENQSKLTGFEIVSIEAKDQALDGKDVLKALLRKKPEMKAEGFPFLAVVNVRTHKAEFINTGALEKNTASSKGHDAEKVFAAIDAAAQKLK